MPAKNHEDYKNELKHLNYTLGYVEESLEKSIGDKTRVDEALAKSRKNLGSDDGNSQEYIDLMINSIFEESVALKVRGLEEARSKPYFARVDFTENGKQETEKLYIGKMSLMKDDKEMVIVDWRAPVANLYYESRLGKASYLCPQGRMEGKMSLKRQFTINQGKLQEIFDIDITTNDEFLQSFLGANADNRLKDIVSTIQVEQNRVIRAPMWKPLVVQGAAGSGKTTIALHRIAYLIYTYEKEFYPENFMILAPSKLFLNYISEVLPELGVEKVKQTTFEDFAMEIIGKRYKIVDPGQKLTDFVDNTATFEDIKRNELVKKESEFKSSMMFKGVLEEYAKIIEKSFIPKEDFGILSFTLFEYDEINSLFLKEYKHLPMMKRVQEIKKHLANRLRQRKDYMADRLQGDCDRRIKQLKETMEDCPERHRLIVEAIDTKNDNMAKLQVLSKKAVSDYIKNISKVDTLKYYGQLMGNASLLRELTHGEIDEEALQFIVKYTTGILASGNVEIEDLAPLMYLKHLIYGLNEKIPVRHIVVDEAQDFSVFQFYVLKNIVKDSSFTILGDIAQGIHSYRGTRSWKHMMECVFPDGQCQYLNLEQSYRTTIEIMEGANKVMEKLHDDSIVPGRPVMRHGQPIEIMEMKSREKIAEDILTKVKQQKKDGYKTAAVICKTMQECKAMAEVLKKSKEGFTVITGKEKEYNGGRVIVPSYLAKGLEFDSVFIADADKNSYTESELDIKLLYVAMTRPLHMLYMYHIGEKTPLIENV